MTAVLTKQFRVFRGPSAVVDAVGPNVLALAGFDGVHTGHHALLRRAADEAAERGLPVGATIFDDRHARRLGHRSVTALTGLGERIRLLREAGMDFVVLFPGNPGAIGVPDQVFTGLVLFGVMQSQLVVIHGRSPASATAGDGLDIEVLPVVRVTSSSWVSASRIRDLLILGDIDRANQLLGRRYQITATVNSTSRDQVRARVSTSRVTPGIGHYRVEVRFHSGRAPVVAQTVCTVAAVGSDTTELVLPLDRSIDHGRLRVSFVSRCADIAKEPSGRSWTKPLSPS